MRNRVFGLVVTAVLVLTAVEHAPVAHAQRQSKCDAKKELEGATACCAAQFCLGASARC